MQIAIFFSHPTQHHAPLFRALAAIEEVDLRVYYFHPGHALAQVAFDPEFKVAYQWDVPLLEGYPYTILPCLLPPTHFLINKKIIANINNNRWDAIFIAGYFSPNNWLIASYARTKKIPVFCFSDANLLSPSGPLKEAVKRLVIRAFFRFISGFLYVGDHNYAYYRYHGVPARKLFWSPIPIDIRRFVLAANHRRHHLAALRRRYAIPEESPVVLFVGKLIDRKRPLDLVQAILRMKLRQEVIALFVGEGPLREAVQAAGGSKVRVTGFINQSEMPSHYPLGAILVMPSGKDPHPLAVTEAACLGVPAVISDRCGCFGPNDILRPGENGYVYPCGNTDRLAEILTNLLQDEPLRQRLGTRAVELAMTQDCTVAARSIINAVNSLLVG
jgi:glycosyltransferase involved in cell wall biosynthesis